jgi:HD superfamily phosphohydrolase
MQEHLKHADDKTADQLLHMDDMGCMHTLRNSQSPVAKMLIGRIYVRQLYKRALYVGQDQVNAAAFPKALTLEKKRELAAAIAEGAGVEPHTVLLDTPAFPRDMSMGVRVKDRNTVVTFEEITPRIRTLNETRREQWRLGVYTLPDQLEPVAEAAADVLHVKKATRQDTLF